MGTTVADLSQPSDGPAQKQDIGSLFLDALVARDFAALQACFQPEVRFRALIPSGVREATDAAAAAAYLRRWFGDADRHVLQDRRAGAVADRLHLAYRFLVHDAGGWQEVEQQVYCSLRDGRIERMDLLCSGFRPVAEPAQATAE